MAATLELKYFNTFWLKKIKSITNIESVTPIVATNTAVETTVINIADTPEKVKVGAGQIVTNLTNTTNFATGVVTVVGRDNLIVTVSTPALSTTTDDQVASASTTLTLNVANVDVIVGMAVSGTGVAAGTYITADPTPGTIYTLNQAATIGASDTYTYVSSINITTSDNLTFTGKATEAGIPKEFPADNATDWYEEESRIRGGYNNTTVDFGVKAYLVADSNQQQNRIAALIYSGVFNSRTGVNNTNQFSVGTDITKSTDPANGSIQRLYAEDTNLIIFQEDKVSRALIDKDAIYSAEGNAAVTSTNLVIGQIVPYAGEYGISTNPESFAVYGYRKYFTDKNRGVVLRLSKDGITEISSYGMHDFFRDELSSLNVDKIIGSWNNHTKDYNISIQHERTSGEVGDNGAVIALVGTNVTVTLNGWVGLIEPGDNIYQYTTIGQIIGGFYGKVVSVVTPGSPGVPSVFICDITTEIPAFQQIIFAREPYKTVTFDEGVLGWTTFLDFKPSQAFSLNNLYYSFSNGELYQHYLGNYGQFYGFTYDSNVTIVLNSHPSVVKVFKTVNYEGAVGWQLESMSGSSGDVTLPIGVYVNQTTLTGLESALFSNNFKKKENKFFANLINNSPSTTGEVLWGNSMTGIKGFFTTVKMKLANVDYPITKKELFSVSSTVVESSY